MHCDHTVHFSADLNLCLDSGHPDTKAYPPTPSRILPVPPGREVEYGCANQCKLGEELNGNSHT